MKKLLIFVPLILGSIIGMLINFNANYLLPSFAIDFKYFPYIWSFLFILMGISYYLIYDNIKIRKLFNLQLFFNLTWSFIFFSFKSILISVIWLVILIILIIKLIKESYKYSELSAYLLLPYLLWSIYALVITTSILIIN